MLYRPTASAQGPALLSESEPLTFESVNYGENDVLAVVGPLRGATVWFRGPPEWAGEMENVTVRLYARAAGTRVKIAEAKLRDAMTTTALGEIHVLVLSCQGIEAEAYEVTVQRSDDGVTSLAGGVLAILGTTQPSPLAVVGDGGIVAGQTVRVASPVSVIQDTASALKATVVQTTPGQLVATVSQSAASSLHTTSTQGAAAAQSGRWPVFLTSGASEYGTSSNPLLVRSSDERAAYAVHVDTTTGTATSKLLCHLWHPSSNARRFEIRRVVLSYCLGTAAAAVRLTLQGNRITASSGGTTVTPEKLDPADAASGATVRKDPTTSTPSSVGLFAVAAPIAAAGVFVWDALARGKPIVLPASQDSGLEIRSALSGTVTAASQIVLSIEWTEV
jgi:hypothetical protein